MANYTVDDILEEINRARGETPQQAKPPLPAEHTPQAQADRSATRMDLPTASPAKEKDPSGATRVMEVLSPDEAALSQRRQEKVNRFMQHSFSSLPDEEEEEEEPPEKGGIDLSAFFGKKARLAEERALSPEEEEDEAPRRKKARHKKDAAEKAPRPKKASDEAFDLGEEAEPEDAGEYRTPADAARVRGELSSLASSLRLRLIITEVCLAVSLYLSFCNLFPIPLLSPICPENNMVLYLVCCLAPLLVSAVASYPVLGNGVTGLFGGRAGHDTPAALCVLAVLAHTVALIASGSLPVGKGNFYTTVAVLTLFANALGKRVMIARITRNFAVASAESGHTAEFLLRSCPLVDDLMEGQGFAEPAIVFSAKAGFPERFLTLSYSSDCSDLLCRIACPLLLFFGAVSSLLAWFVFKQGAIGGLGVFCVMMCISSALTETLVGNLPLWRASRALSSEGAFIAGYASAEEFEDMNAVAVEATELYPAGSAVLHGIKAFDESRIDEAILDAASVMHAVDGVLKDVFLETIGGRTSILKPVSLLVYEEQKGISASVDGKTVLIGNRELLEKHGVAAPPLEYEEKFTKGDRDVLYLANDGKATAMFVLGYRVSRTVAHWLGVLAKKDLSLIVHSTDPNITAHRIAADYGYHEEYIRVVPARLRRQYLETTAPRKEAPAWAMTLEGSRVRLRLVAALHTLRQSVRLGTVLQTAGLIFGYALAAFLAFFGSIESMGFVQLIAYQLFWALAASLIPMLRRF